MQFSCYCVSVLRKIQNTHEIQSWIYFLVVFHTFIIIGAPPNTADDDTEAPASKQSSCLVLKQRNEISDRNVGTTVQDFMFLIIREEPKDPGLDSSLTRVTAT